MIGQTISHYRILDKLGEGGMGVVYVAEDTRLRRRVAIKFSNCFSAEGGGRHFRGRFLREARSVSALTHPHIAAVYDYGETSDGRPFIVMELVRGRHLGELMREDGLTLTRAVKIVEEIAAALAEAHRHGIIHRDIKPSNVMINDRGEVKMLDFGLAKQLHEEFSGEADTEAPTLMTTHTLSGVVVGTPLYFSPEQATSAPVDARSDLFALGALLYECIAGRPPFSGVNTIEVCAQILHVDPPPPSHFNTHIPPELDRITLKALAKNPGARYQSADEMIAALRAVTTTSAGRTTARHGEESLATHRIPRISGAAPRSSAMTTLSETLRRPRFSAIFLAGFLGVALFAAWGALRWWRRPVPYNPAPEARRWYEEGESALRDGTYHKASKALENAIGADERFALAHARLAEAWMELDYGDRAKDEIIRVKSLVPDPAVLDPLEALRLEAITHTVTRNFAAAVENYREIVRRVPDQEKAYAYVDLGHAYEKNEELEKAVESYTEATNRNPQAAAAFLHLGTLYGRRQDLASAARVLARAENLYRALSNYEGVTEVLYQRGLIFNSLDKLAEARQQLQQALEMTRTTASRYQQIQILLQLSSVACIEGNTARAQAYATEAIDLARADKMENLATDGIIDLGNAFFSRGDYAAARKFFHQAYEFAQKYNGGRNTARAQLSLGSLFIQQGETDAGLRYVEQALAFYRQGGYRKKASQALLLIGRATQQKGDYAAALEAFEQQLRLAEEVGDPSQLALAHESIGTLLGNKEQFGAALAHYDESYRINKSLDARLKIGYDLLNRGDMLWQLGRYTEARAAFDAAVALANRPDGTVTQLLALIHLFNARMLLSERRFDEAGARGRQALMLAGTEYKDIAVQARCVIGVAHSLAGAKREGRRACEEAAAMAARTKDPWLISNARLGLAETLVEEGDAGTALAMALPLAEDSFAQTGQQASQWRAWLLAARAGRLAGDETKARDYAARAARLLDELQQKWGAEEYRSYLSRPDVHHARRQLDDGFAVN